MIHYHFPVEIEIRAAGPADRSRRLSRPRARAAGAPLTGGSLSAPPRPGADPRASRLGRPCRHERCRGGGGWGRGARAGTVTGGRRRTPRGVRPAGSAVADLPLDRPRRRRRAAGQGGARDAHRARRRERVRDYAPDRTDRSEDADEVLPPGIWERFDPARWDRRARTYEIPSYGPGPRGKKKKTTRAQIKSDKPSTPVRTAMRTRFVRIDSKTLSECHRHGCGQTVSLRTSQSGGAAPGREG